MKENIKEVRKMKAKKLIVYLFFICLFPIYTKAATSLSASTQSPVVGSFVYVQLNIDYGEDISIREAHYSISYEPSTLNLEEIYWTQSVGRYNLESGTIYIDKDSTSSSWGYGGQVVMKFQVIKSGRSRVDIKETSPALYDDGNPVSQTMSGITINAVEPKSDTTIGSLYINGYDLNPTFRRTEYSYKVTVPAEVMEVEVIASKGDERQTITGDGIRKLAYGDNRVQVMVMAEDGSVATYDIMITRKDNRTGDTSLKSVHIVDANVVYKEEEDTYSATVSKSVESVLITAIANDPYATVIGTGTKELQIGQNVFEIKVTTTGGNEKVYKILITRSSHELEENFKSTKLMTLTVDRMVLDLTQNKKVFLVGTEKGKSALDIKAITESQTASVEIVGNENLKTGFNKIEIKVKEKNEEENIYTIIAYKNPSTIINIADFNEITENKKTLFYNSYESNLHKLTKEQVKKVIERENTLYYNVTNIYGGILYQIRIKEEVEDLNLSLKRVNTTPLVYEINLPENLDITLYVGDIYKDSMIKIYTYNEEGNYTLLTEGATIKNGYLHFTTNKEKYYCFTYNSLIKKEDPFSLFWKQYSIPIFILGISVLIILFIFKNRKKNDKVEKEPLY